MAKPILSIPSNQPDPRVLHILAVLQSFSLIVVTFLAAVTLAAWIVPPLGGLLPAAWDHMKANTALCALLCALSLNLSKPRRSVHSILISHILSLVVVIIAVVTIVERLLNCSTWIDTFLTAHTVALHGDRPTPQIAYSFLLIAILTLGMRIRKSPLAYLIDAITLALCMVMLIFVSGYIIGTLRLFGGAMFEHFSPQTLACFVLLSFTAFNRRTEYGVFKILIGDGIGGKIARLASPFALALPLILTAGRDYIVRAHVFQTQYVNALTAAACSLLAFCLILALCRRIDSLEKKIRDLSLRDELTGLYNRRGFYVLAEQALRLARRAGEPFSVLFIDMDNLKRINDAQGHEAGSTLLQEMASILNATFRETDVIGRLGGDEFVVAGRANAAEIARAAQRLDSATALINSAENRLYTIGFSSGHVTTDESDSHILEHLLEHADRIMYETKRRKKSFRADPPPDNHANHEENLAQILG
jgi:diguanylate cyclase (GGDEF)-like protein